MPMSELSLTCEVLMHTHQAGMGAYGRASAQRQHYWHAKLNTLQTVTCKPMPSIHHCSAGAGGTCCHLNSYAGEQVKQAHLGGDVLDATGDVCKPQSVSPSKDRDLQACRRLYRHADVHIMVLPDEVAVP